MTDTAYIAPRLTLRVGVTGHRPNKLEKADTPLLLDRAGAVLRCLAESVGQLKHENDALGDDAPFSRDPPELRLATAIAEGTDRIVADAAITAGYGLNLILPFPRDTYAGDFEGAALDDFRRLLAEPAVRSVTELDTGAKAQDPLAYQAAGRLMLAHSDVVIAIWDGLPSDGIGGTEEIVSEARRRGLTVVLIAPTGEVKLWTVPENATDALEDGVWVDLDVDGHDCRSNALAGQINVQLGGPLWLAPKPAGDGHAGGANPANAEPAGSESGERDNARSQPARRHQDHGSAQLTPMQHLDRLKGEKLREGSYSCSYQLLRWLFLPRGEGTELSVYVSYRLQDERESAWKQTLDTAGEIAGNDFRDMLDRRLRDRWISADNLALHYSTRFRSAFVGNFLMAATAVMIGLLAVFFWDSKGHKAVFVSIELVLIAGIIWITYRGRSQHWRDRWLDYRSLAEALRPARLPMLIGSSPILPGGRTDDLLGKSWIAWYVRAAIREIPPPTALIDAAALKTAIGVAMQEEVNGQIDYHDKNANRLKLLDHRLERTADLMLKATLVSGLGFLLLYGFYRYEIKEPAEHFKPWATLFGGALPVFGAAIFGIRATADFRSVMNQSMRMVAELKRLRSALEGQISNPDRSTLHRLFGRVGQTMSDDLRVWNMIYGERELTAGF